MSDAGSSSSAILQENATAYQEQLDKETVLSDALDEKKAEEAAPEVSPEEPKQEDQFAPKFAALSRKEKALRQREEQLEARLAELEEKTKNLDSEYGGYKNIKNRLQTEPLKVMEESGLTFDELTKMILENDGAPTPDMQIKHLREELDGKYSKELEALKQELKEKEEQSQQKQYQDTIEDYMVELGEHISDNSDRYEMIKASDAVDLVYQVVEEHYNETGKILSNDEACEHVENYLLEEAKKYLNLSKVKSLLGSEEPTEKPVKAPRQSSVTLSNADASEVPTKGRKHMSNEESLRNAAKLIRWDD